MVADSDSMPNYGEGPQGEYSSVDGKAYIGQADSYFNTPYRQPVQSNWPLTHQQIGLSGDMHQQNENVKGLREEASRKRPNPPPPAPDLPHEIIPSPERRPIALPPDYYYEDSNGGRHPTNSQSHSGNSNYQQLNGISPTHNQMVEQQKAGTASNHDVPPENNQEKMKKEEDDLEESPLKHAKNTQKAAALKVMSPQHVLPVHSSVKHEAATQNNEGSNDVPDGESGRPKGAILSLTLGMGITAIMIALMAWRIRVIKRRLRRVGGKSPYAHDADYLVNGMYL
ncbi:hypothetical protein J437_LFUL019008 [Ladona fulva]|uniref:Uncharacterized protein n=1 Tax=Ladona fulva TaxID=123851 RepID=A0A8K0KR49_LADFU|nr:hypothetical protein J437_LFUL019008 [Ladona fulva]